MSKLEYFIYSVKNNLFLKRAWLISFFAIMDKSYTNEFLSFKDGEMWVKVDGEDVKITDYKPNNPLFVKNEKVKVLNNQLPFIEGDVDTSYGRLIINCLLFWYPYQGKVKYQNEYMKPGFINDIAYELLKSSKSNVEEHIRFENAASMLTCLSQLGVPSASRKAITPNPKIPTLKKKLLSENKNKLGDPAVIADIQNQIIAADKEYLAGDTSLGFFIKNKNWNVSRLKTVGMYGAEPDFYDESKLSLMTTSLSEGWNKDNLPMLINNLRGGSYSRSKETALGGESTKVTSRIFQNYKIDIEDCGSEVGLTFKVTKVNYNNFIGRYLVGSTAPLDEDKLKSLLDKKETIKLRSPAFCKATGTSFCKKCFGHKVADGGLGLNSQSIIATSTFMAISMSAMHSKQLVVEEYDFLDRIA